MTWWSSVVQNSLRNIEEGSGKARSSNKPRDELWSQHTAFKRLSYYKLLPKFWNFWIVFISEVHRISKSWILGLLLYCFCSCTMQYSKKTETVENWTKQNPNYPKKELQWNHKSIQKNSTITPISSCSAFLCGGQVDSKFTCTPIRIILLCLYLMINLTWSEASLGKNWGCHISFGTWLAWEALCNILTLNRLLPRTWWMGLHHSDLKDAHTNPILSGAFVAVASRLWVLLWFSKQ